MSTYVTAQDLVDEFGERELVDLTDVAPVRTHQVDFTVAQRVCDRANAEIGAALQGRYTLPLAAVPALLKYVGQDLAHYYLYQSPPPSWVQARFDQARRTLRDLATGTLTLGPDAAGAAVAAPAQDMPAFVPGDKAFARSAKW